MTAVEVSDIADVDAEAEESGGRRLVGERVLGVLGPARVSRPSASLHPSSSPRSYLGKYPSSHSSSPPDECVSVVMGRGTVLPSGEKSTMSGDPRPGSRTSISISSPSPIPGVDGDREDGVDWPRRGASELFRPCRNRWTAFILDPPTVGLFVEAEVEAPRVGCVCVGE